ncbi:hypothetical protein J2W28_005945 [Variovorax boronicumulans]|nr:hypothetical protein [Variovorax boronicumulans]MDP9995763.1 hypothetical protein [Variovorax boronicumulans]MDQ0006772.1 hypothetical protein [Variovorax boronicumulans]
MAEFVELSVEERLEALVQAAYGVIQHFPRTWISPGTSAPSPLI